MTETYYLSPSEQTRAGTDPTRAPFCFAFNTVKAKTGFFGWLEGEVHKKHGDADTDDRYARCVDPISRRGYDARHSVLKLDQDRLFHPSVAFEVIWGSKTNHLGTLNEDVLGKVKDRPRKTSKREMTCRRIRIRIGSVLRGLVGPCPVLTDGKLQALFSMVSLSIYKKYTGYMHLHLLYFRLRLAFLASWGNRCRCRRWDRLDKYAARNSIFIFSIVGRWGRSGSEVYHSR